jgi:hypothetical protein
MANQEQPTHVGNESSTNGQLSAAVIGVQGRVIITREDGSVVPAREGQTLLMGDTIKTEGSSVAVLSFQGLQPLSLGYDQALTLDQALLKLLAEITESDSAGDTVNFDLLAQAIESGLSFDELLPAAAAGGGEVNSSGSSSASAVRIELTNKQVTPDSGFETTTFINSRTVDPELGAVTDLPLDNETSLNIAPVTLGFNSVTTAQGTPVVIDVAAAFSDADGDSLTFTVECLPA